MSKLPTKQEMEELIEKKIKATKALTEKKKIEKVGLLRMQRAIEVVQDQDYEIYDYKANDESNTFFALLQREDVVTWAVLDPDHGIIGYDPYHYINKNEKKALIDVAIDESGKDKVLDSFIEILLAKKV